MDAEELKILRALDTAVYSKGAKTVIEKIVTRVRARLSTNPGSDMAWEPVPLETYSSDLPPFIRSSWVFILRAKTITGAERHPNSHQRMLAYDGSGDFQTRGDGPWQSNYLTSDPAASIEERWISIPVGVWHQSAGPEKDWVVVSFHTVEAEDLIEERPGDGDEGGAGEVRQMKYLDSNQADE